MSDAQTEQIEFVASSGNVFADLGLSNPVERLAKAELAFAITQRLRERGLSHTDAAVLFAVDASRVAALQRGRLTRFTYDNLLHFLNLLGCNVHITLEPISNDAEQGQTFVTTRAA